MKKSLFTLAWLAAGSIGAAAHGQATTTYEDGPDGGSVKSRVKLFNVPFRRQNPDPSATSLSAAGYNRYQSYQQTYLTRVNSVSIRFASTKLVEPVHGSVLDARPATGDTLGSTARHGADPGRAHELGSGNADNASAGDDVSHSGGRIHESRPDERCAAART